MFGPHLFSSHNFSVRLMQVFSSYIFSDCHNFSFSVVTICQMQIEPRVFVQEITMILPHVLWNCLCVCVVSAGETI